MREEVISKLTEKNQEISVNQLSDSELNTYQKLKDKKMQKNKSKILNESMYETDSVLKLVIKVLTPSFLISLLFGIYIFIDQVLMQHLIPENGINYFSDALIQKGLTSEQVITVFKEMNASYTDYTDSELLKAVNKDMIVYQTTVIGTVNLIFISIGLFINSGASVLYSRALAEKNLKKCKDVWVTSFYGCLILSLLIMALILAIQPNILKACIAKQDVDGSGNPLIGNQLIYGEVRYDLIADATNRYLYFITGSIPIIMILNLYIFFLRAEGINGYLTVAALVANLFNVLCDLLFFLAFKMDIMGGGLATFLGYILNFGMIIGFVVVKEYNLLPKKDNLSSVKFSFSFKDLLNFKINFNYLITSLILSLGTFLRDVSLAAANIVYVVVFINTFQTIKAIDQLNDVLVVSGTPIYNLFFFALCGIIDGLRPILAYNYQKQNYKRVQEVYYSGIITSLIFSVIINALFWMVYLIGGAPIAAFFNAKSEGQISILTTLFMTLMFQFPFLSISISGLSLLQSTGKMIMNIIASLLQGAIVFYPELYTMSAISIATNSYMVMLFTGFTNIAISSIIIEVISSVYLHFFMGKREKSKDPTESFSFIINKVEKCFLKLKRN